MAKHINVRVHNKKTLELKLEYIPKGQPDKSDYIIDLYLSLPENMGINENSYEKKYFYHDLFRSIRLKSPDYMLNHYYERLKHFDESCSEGVHDWQCVYAFKKFITGYRSMLRNSAAALGKTSIQADIDYLLENVHKNRNIFRKLHRKFRDENEMFALADEFTSIVTNMYLVRLYERTGDNKALMDTIKGEIKYRKKHFPQSVPGNDERNSTLIDRYDYLKGYFYNVLSLRAKRKVGDKAMKSILYATAAGISMIVATVIAFWAQQKYGNFTLPFFVALVVGYMFKDRIKDGFKSILEKIAAPVIYDYVTLIYESRGKHAMGKTWERADFINNSHIPAELSSTLNRKVIHFNKKVHIENAKIKELLDPEIHGITDLMRLNIKRFTSGLEEPLQLMYSVREGELEKTMAEKTYRIEMFLRVSATGNAEELKGELTLTSKGIKNFRIL